MPSWLVGAVGALIVGLPTTVAAVLTYRAATRAQERSAEVEDRKVDQAAFQTAQGIYERGIAEVNRQLGQCREELAVERQETRRLRGRVARLEQALRSNNIAVPNGIE